MALSMNYVSLHNHSDASLDGAGTVQSLVNQAQKIGMKALALTDHGTLANAVAFWSACEDCGIVPILGMEAYLQYDATRYHITLLSLSETGFNNLIHLDSWSHAQNYVTGYPLITLHELHERRTDLFALTGCASSRMFKGSELEAEVYVGDLVDAMGKDQVGLEAMFVGTHNTWSRPLAIANRTKLPLVITNDTHYPCQDQFHAHQVVVNARRGFTYDSRQLWLKTASEIVWEGKRYVPEVALETGLANTLRIAERAVPWSMKSPPSLPVIPDVLEKLASFLKEAARNDIARKGEREKRVARLKYEFNFLRNSGFLDYIYILWDIVLWARDNSIRVGPGRGSGSGSYVLYLLGITALDPIQHGLIFERFLNEARGDYPDVDVDFESDRRSEVMEYASRRWGAVPIATYSCYSHKSAVHDIARVLKIPKSVEVKAADAERDSDAFEEFCMYDPDVRDTYETMLGQIRHRGKHAAGVIIPNRPVPIERSGDELVAAWAEGMNTKDLSKVGIVKYDLLGLTALSQLKLMEEVTGEKADETLECPSVYDLFCSGDVSGIFQWSGSDGIRQLTQRIAPRNFYDLATCNALYRPGALDAGTAEHYPDYRKKPRLLHPRIDKHLVQTYGVICYQEQVMAIVAEVMGGDLGKADVVRRLISKASVGDPKWESEMDKLYRGFVKQGVEGGLEEELVEKLWHEIYTHSRYSFNLSHAISYTYISYQMAWYKVHHRAAFTLSTLQYDRANAQTYILDAVNNGMKIAMPHINYSERNYTLHGNTIYLPLSDISYLGEKGVVELIGERIRGGNFTSYEDFNKRIAKRACNNRARGMLERIGAFEGLVGNPGEAIKDYAELPIKDKYQTQLEILGYIVPSPVLLAKIKKLEEKAARPGYTRYTGFISRLENKKSSHGPYAVYHLSPTGSFWVRGEADFSVGQFVSGTKSRFGHSTDTRAYNLGSE